MDLGSFCEARQTSHYEEQQEVANEAVNVEIPKCHRPSAWTLAWLSSSHIQGNTMSKRYQRERRLPSGSGPVLNQARIAPANRNGMAHSSASNSPGSRSGGFLEVPGDPATHFASRHAKYVRICPRWSNPSSWFDQHTVVCPDILGDEDSRELSTASPDLRRFQLNNNCLG